MISLVTCGITCHILSQVLIVYRTLYNKQSTSFKPHGYSLRRSLYCMTSFSSLHDKEIRETHELIDLIIVFFIERCKLSIITVLQKNVKEDTTLPEESFDSKQTMAVHHNLPWEITQPLSITKDTSKKVEITLYTKQLCQTRGTLKRVTSV